jgi:hypothetical protein
MGTQAIYSCAFTVGKHIQYVEGVFYWVTHQKMAKLVKQQY